VADLEKLQKKKEKYLPQSWRGMRAAAKLADELMRREQATKQPDFAGVEVFDPETPHVLEVRQEAAPIVEAAPPAIIGNFEHPKAFFYTEMIHADLDNPAMRDISETTRQALADAPFSDEFRKLMEAFIVVQKHQRGKGPMYRGEKS
jgi:hypothetical protein